MIYQYYEFENGIRLVHKQQKGHVAHLGIIVKVGSRDETIEQQGMAHFIEHMIFKGTLRRSNYRVLSRLENVGADLNAFTTKEDTSVFASIQSSYFDRAAELLSDIILNSIFPEKEIQKEKAIILDEINSYRDNPAEWIYDEFDEVVFKTHPLGRNILGNKKTISKFNRESILNFYHQFYTPDRLVISSIGPFSFQRVVSVFKKYFSQQYSKSVQTIENEAINYLPTHLVRKYSKHQAHAVLGNIACSAHDNQRTAMALLNNMIGGPAMNSLLNIALREKHGIAYNLESNYQAFSDSGLFSIYFGTDESQLEKAINITHKELDKLKLAKLSTIKLHTAIRQLKGQLAISLESHQNEMLAMGKNMIVYNVVDSVAEIHRRIDSITTQQIQELANLVFDKNQLSSLVFTNQKELNP